MRFFFVLTFVYSEGGRKPADHPTYDSNPVIRWTDEMKHLYSPSPADAGKYELLVVTYGGVDMLETPWADGSGVRFTAPAETIEFYRYIIEYRNQVYGKVHEFLPLNTSSSVTPGVFLRTKADEEPLVQRESLALAFFFNWIIYHTVRFFGQSRFTKGTENANIYPLPVADLQFKLKRLEYNRQLILSGIEMSPVADWDKDVDLTAVETKRLSVAECAYLALYSMTLRVDMLAHTTNLFHDHPSFTLTDQCRLDALLYTATTLLSARPRHLCPSSLLAQKLEESLSRSSHRNPPHRKYRASPQPTTATTFRGART